VECTSDSRRRTRSSVVGLERKKVMRPIRSAVLMGTILTMLVCVAFVTVIATGAAIPAAANIPAKPSLSGIYAGTSVSEDESGPADFGKQQLMAAILRTHFSGSGPPQGHQGDSVNRRFRCDDRREGHRPSYC
jgi:hypothetical protein